MGSWFLQVYLKQLAGIIKALSAVDWTKRGIIEIFDKLEELLCKFSRY